MRCAPLQFESLGTLGISALLVAVAGGIAVHSYGAASDLATASTWAQQL